MRFLIAVLVQLVAFALTMTLLSPPRRLAIRVAQGLVASVAWLALALNIAERGDLSMREVTTALIVAIVLWIGWWVVTVIIGVVARALPNTPR